jgi:hypothetical protein
MLSRPAASEDLLRSAVSRQPSALAGTPTGTAPPDLTEPRRDSPVRKHAGFALSTAGLLAVVTTWLVSLLRFDGDLRSMSDLGLVSVLPLGALVGVGLLTVNFCLTLWRLPTRTTLLTGHVLALIVMLFGTPALIEEVARFTISWRHAGIVELVARTGTVRPDLDVYGNWPGFFVLVGFLSRAAGHSNVLGFAEWASVFFNAAYLGPLLLLYRSVAVNPRTIWLAIWIFYSANWIAQDYLAPQAFGYLLYLSSIALLLHMYSSRASLWRRLVSSRQRVSVAGIILVILFAAASVPTHQLTPVQLTISLAGLALVWRRVPRALPVFIACVVAAWAVFMATPYLDGHLTGVISDVGRIGSSVEEGVSARVAGSEDHLFVVRTRLALSVAIALLAVAGCARLLAEGGKEALDRRLLVLALAPALLPAVQSYGGEVGLRAFFFALPFLAFFAANLFHPPWTHRVSLRGTTATALVLLVILAAFGFARYGNERADFFTRNEVSAFEYVYDHASPTSLLAVAASNAPWKFERYELHEYVVANKLDGWDEAAQSGNWSIFLKNLAARMNEVNTPSYLVITRSAKAGTDLVGDRPGAVEAFERVVRRSKLFQIVFSNSDAVVATARNAP